MSFKSENCVSERIYLTNLRLLGFSSEDKDVSLCSELFDHPNQKAFHQVMYFLLKKLDAEKVKQEFRDCWPVLDKKQESEFRRKCSNWMKEIQRCNPEEFSHVNPALFQSPGGRKFVLFLRGFTKYIMSQQLAQADIFQIKKPVSKRKDTIKLSFNNLVNKTEDHLLQGVRYQEDVEDVLNKSKPNARTISQKYFQMKTRKEMLKKEIEEKKKKIEEKNSGEKKCYSVLSKLYEERYSVLKQRIENLKAVLDSSASTAAEIRQLTDSTVERPSLDFTSLPPELVKDTDLLMTFDHLMQQGLTSYRRCADLPTKAHFSSAPTQDMDSMIGKLTGQAEGLRELRSSLSNLKVQLDSSVNTLAKASQEIDWKTVFTPADSQDRDSPELVLLPPTPNCAYQKQVAGHGSSVKSLKSSSVQSVTTPEVISRLKLFSPVSAAQQRGLPAKQSQVSSENNLLNIPQDATPASKSKGMKFSRKVTPDQKKFRGKMTPEHSPLLKMTLIQSTMHRQTNTGGRAQEDSISSQVSESKASLEVFSPGLCSTRLLKPEDLASAAANKLEDFPGVKEKIPGPEPCWDAVPGKLAGTNQDLAVNMQQEISRVEVKTSERADALSITSKSTCSEQPTSNSDQLIASSQQLISSTDQLIVSNTKPVSVEELCGNDSSDDKSVNNKIEMYRKFLQSVNHKLSSGGVNLSVCDVSDRKEAGNTSVDKEEKEGGSVTDRIVKSSLFASEKPGEKLLEVWNKARESISPRTSPAYRRTSRLCNLGDNLENSFTDNLQQQHCSLEPHSLESSLADVKQNPDMIGTRLEALMESLALSDSSHDLSLGRMSFGEDLMLSPHCP